MSAACRPARGGPLQPVIFQPLLQFSFVVHRHALLQGQHIALRQQAGVDLVVLGQRPGAVPGIQGDMPRMVFQQITRLLRLRAPARHPRNACRQAEQRGRAQRQQIDQEPPALFFLHHKSPFSV